MKQLSIYTGVNRTATIFYVKNALPFMVVCHDEEEDFTRTEFFINEQEAEDFAEDWTL